MRFVVRYYSKFVYSKFVAKKLTPAMVYQDRNNSIGDSEPRAATMPRVLAQAGAMGPAKPQLEHFCGDHFCGDLDAS